MPDFTNPFVLLFTGLGGTLLFASLVGLVLRHAVAKGQPNAVIDNLVARVNAWWWMVGLLGLVFWMGRSAVIGFLRRPWSIAPSASLSPACCRVCLSVIGILQPRRQRARLIPADPQHDSQHDSQPAS